MTFEPIYLFIFAGLVAMSAALSAGALNKLPLEQKPAFMQKGNGTVMVVMAGNLAALTLLGAMAYGFLTLTWWIPLSCLFISFPVLHVILFQRVLGDLKNLILMTVLVLAAIPTLYINWPA